MKAFSLALALLAGADAARVRMEPDVHVFSAPSWTRGARVTADDSVKLQFFMKLSDARYAALDAKLLDVSAPASAAYGEFLDADAAAALVGAPPAAIDTVVEYVLAAAHAAVDLTVSRNRDIVSVTLPATTVEAMLETELYHFAHLRQEVSVVRCGAPYSLPDDVAEHVSLVGELIRLPRLRELRPIAHAADAAARADASSAWSACGTRYSTFVNPAVLQERYGFPSLAAADVAAGNSMAVAEFQMQYYDDDDLENFASTCGTTTTKVANTYGGNSPSRCKIGAQPCVEALLDIEYIGAVAANIPLSVYYSGTYSLLDWAQTVQDGGELVQSVSYGNDEAQQTSAAYMRSVNAAFMALGTKGVTVLFASGDQGVWGREGLGSTYHPDFPAASPYVTAVGGTDFATKSTIGEETTWEDGGGGFSDTFAIPSFQADAVADYLHSDNLPSSTFYNSTGRGYPDVAALAGTQNAYLVSYKAGSIGGVGGTSAACPVFAGVVAHLNNVRLSSGGSSMGWMNPWIYTNGASVLNDVTSGVNSGGYTGGFPAVAGWDAATGYGTPNFDAMQNAL